MFKHLLHSFHFRKASILATEEFIGLLTECLSEQTFVIDYERHYSVALDMEILKQACEDL